MGETTVARMLARFLNNISCDTLDADVILRAKNLILDSLACAVGGIDAKCAKIALKNLAWATH